MAGAPAAAIGDAWSEANPAGWSDATSFGVHLHAAQLYELEELRAGAAQLTARMFGTSLVVGARSFGFEDYRSNVFTVGLARRLLIGTHRPFDLGLRFRRHHVVMRNYGSGAAAAISAGLLFPILDGIRLGLSSENILVDRGAISDDLPRRLTAGLSFVGSELLHVHVDVIGDPRGPLVSRLAFESHPFPFLAFRSGFSLEPPKFAGGMGMRLAAMAFDFAAERHAVLGWSPSCSIGLRW